MVHYVSLLAEHKPKLAVDDTTVGGQYLLFLCNYYALHGVHVPKTYGE